MLRPSARTIGLTAAALACVLTVAACDPDPAPPPAPSNVPARQSSPINVEVAGVIPAQRPTHLAPDPSGAVFLLQESEATGNLDGGASSVSIAQQRVFVLGEQDVPQATSFGAAAILKAVGQPDGTGTIQSLCAGSDGNLYFFFLGGQKRQLLALLGCYVPRKNEVRIIASTAELSRISNMGNSLVLARGSVVRSGDLVWLWLRHADDGALISLDVGRVGATLRRNFQQPRCADGAVKLRSMREDLSGGAEGALLYLDRNSGVLWRITPLGDATRLHHVADLPRNITTPVYDTARQRVVFLATPGQAVNESASPPNPATSPAMRFPSLLLIENGQRRVLGPDLLKLPTRLNPQDFSPATTTIVRQNLLIYNAPTGDLLRLKLPE